MIYKIAVRELVEFTAKQGDLDLRFTPAPSAQEGIEGHKLVQSRRPAGYQCEISLQANYRQLHVRGRADGYDAAQNQLEEIKTCRGDISLMPDNQRALHWAQCRIYGHLWLAAKEATLPPENDILRLALVYFDIDSEKEIVYFENHNRASLALYFQTQCELFLCWAEQELAHRQQRDSALSTLAFPWPEFRHGQRELAAAVYNAQRKACCLMVQAPTGIGKTIATLFPALKACPTQGIDKVFFLTAKTSGRQVALDALQTLDAAPLRVLELVARDKACEHPELACHGQSCPLANGFYDRLPAARSAALTLMPAGTLMLDQARLREAALQHQVCPYYLSQEMSRWADLIVADYNYFFDISAMLYGLTRQNQWRVSLLIDEAHNLLNRGRSMYSAELDQARFHQARRQLPPALKKTFTQVQRHWKALIQESKSENKPESKPDTTSDTGADYQALESPPKALLQALQHATGQIADHMVDQPRALAPEILNFFFDAHLFIRLSELFDQHSIIDLTRQGKNAVLNLRNLIPAPFLRERFASCHASTLFSATLGPSEFYRDTLGLPEDCHWVEIDSPFERQQLEIHLVRHISTRYHERQHSLGALVQLMEQQYQRQPGNYLAFLSSFEYLEQVAERFRQHAPDVPVWQQTKHMDEGARQAFLGRFTQNGQGIGFAVLGGNFGEGIDLPGARLIGAFITTLGLPQFNPVNEIIMQRMHSQFGQGYAYAYLYPGLQKVVQAAGRVIRSPTDQGTLYLIDDRFTRPEVQALLPKWWQIGAQTGKTGHTGNTPKQIPPDPAKLHLPSAE
jgi:DNA excision repair protein ERCC-2